MGKRILLLSMVFLLVFLNLPVEQIYSEGNKELVKAPISLTRRAVKTDVKRNDQDPLSSQFVENEEFIIEYTIKPQNIPLKNIAGENYNKNKEIVLVMDISGSMDEKVYFNLYNDEEDRRNEDTEYSSAFDINNGVKNINVHLIKGRDGNDIHDYYVTFDEPNNGIDNNKRFLIFYSKDDMGKVERYIKDMDTEELIELYYKNRVNWVNPWYNYNDKYWFDYNQKDIYGNKFKEEDYYVYVATINYYNENGGPGHVVGLARSEDVIESTSDKERKINVMKIVSKNFLEKLKDNDKVKVALVPYETSAIYTTYNGNDFATLTDDTTYPLHGSYFTQYEDLLYDIENLNAEGGTNIGDGLRKAYYKLHNSEDNDADKYIILMTDGEPTFYSYTDEKNNFKVKRNRYYYLGEDDNYHIGGNGSTGTEKDQRYAEIIGEELISKAPFNINTFVIGFSNGINEGKLNSIADAANGYYKEADNGNALDIVYNQLAEQIDSDLPIHTVYFEEVFPDDIEVVDVLDTDNRGISLNFEGQKVYGDLGGISYRLNEDTNEFEAEPINFSIRLKGTRRGEYLLGNNGDSNEDIYSYIRYIDLTGEETVKNFPPLNISILEAEPPEVSAILIQNTEDKEKYNLSITIKDPCSLKVYNEDSLLGEIDSREEFAEDEVSRVYDIEINKDNLTTESILLKIKDLNGNEFPETISLLTLDNVIAEDHVHNDNTRPVTLYFKGETNLIFNNITINSKAIPINVASEDNIYRQEVVLIDGTNEINVEIVNQYNNKSILTLEGNIDAISPIISPRFIENNTKVLLEFSEEVNDLWFEITREGEEPEIVELKDYIGESKLDSIIDYNNDWNEREIKIYARDLAGNIGTEDLIKPTRSQILSHGIYIDSTNTIVSGEMLNVVRGYEVTFGAKLKVNSINPIIDLHLNKERNENIDSINNSFFILYKLNEQGEIIESYDILSDNVEVLYTDEIEKKYRIELPIEETDCEYILVYKSMAESQKYNEVIVNEITLDGLAEEIKINIEDLPSIE